MASGNSHRFQESRATEYRRRGYLESPSVSTLGRAATPFVSLQMSSKQTTNLCMEQMFVPMVACVQGGDFGQTMTKKAMRNQTQQSFVSQNILLATLTVSDRHSWEWWVLFLSPKKHNRKQTQNRGGYCLTTGSAQPHGGECLRRGRCKVPLPVLPRVGLLHNRYLQEG